MSLSIECASVTAIWKSSDRRPNSPTVCTDAIISRKIALIDYDIFFQNSTCIYIRIVIKRTACGIHKCRKPVQLTSIGDLVVSSCLVQRCRLVMCFALFLGAEAVFVEVMKFILVDIAYIASFAAFSKVYHAVGVVQNRNSVCVITVQILVEVYRVALGLAAVQQVSDFTAGELFCGFAAIFIFCVCEVVAICDWANIVSTYTAYIST